MGKNNEKYIDYGFIAALRLIPHGPSSTTLGVLKNHVDQEFFDEKFINKRYEKVFGGGYSTEVLGDGAEMNIYTNHPKSTVVTDKHKENGKGS